MNVRWLVETLVAFFLAMGVAAHALDELHGRPLRTRIPDGVLVGPGRRSDSPARSRSVSTVRREVSPWIWAFIAAGVFLVLAYNLELFGGSIHSDLWFALAWGAFPVLTASFAQTARIEPEAVAVAAACAIISAAQRVLSTPVRRLRRRGRDRRGCHHHARRRR